MGQDKLTLKVGDATLLNRVHDALVAPNCAEILVVGDGEYAPVGARRVPDLRPGQGPLAGIEAGLSAASYRSVFVAAGDMPFLTGKLVRHLLGLLSASVPAAVPYLGGRPHPLCSAYAREIQSTVSAALDRDVRSVREFLEDLPGILYVGEKELRSFGEPELLLTSVNSPEDLARARAALHDIAPGRS